MSANEWEVCVNSHFSKGHMLHLSYRGNAFVYGVLGSGNVNLYALWKTPLSRGWLLKSCGSECAATFKSQADFLFSLIKEEKGRLIPQLMLLQWLWQDAHCRFTMPGGLRQEEALYCTIIMTFWINLLLYWYFSYFSPLCLSLPYVNQPSLLQVSSKAFRNSSWLTSQPVHYEAINPNLPPMAPSTTVIWPI